MEKKNNKDSGNVYYYFLFNVIALFVSFYETKIRDWD